MEKLMAALVALLNAPVRVKPTCSISKSRYVAGIQCPKRLYLQVHSPELAILDDQAKAVMAQGTTVGVLARRAFPGGVLVTADREHLAEAIRHTRELISNREVPAIYEATFEHHGVLVRIDVLQRCGEAFRLIEVKSSTETKPHYSHDVGVQKYVAEGNDLRIASACVMHLNRNYVFDGSQAEDGSPRYDLPQLFVIEEIEPTTAAFISRQLSHAFTILENPDPPEIEPGEQCKAPYRCEFYDICNREWPPDDIRSLPITKWKIDGLRQCGFCHTNHLPDPFALRALYHLTEKECMMAITAKEQRMRISSGLAAELATLRFPVCYLDFETLWPALPWFPGMRPYDHIVYQWSALLQQHAYAPPIRWEFLWEKHDDPRVPFVKSLLEVVAAARTIVVYNASFESSRIQELAKCFPQYESALLDARDKLWDLLPVIRRNLYHPAFCGSYSLKRVLPALLPGDGYEHLEIADGSHAGLAWLRRLSTHDSSETARLRNALLEYCAQDTAALARIVTLLFGLAESLDSSSCR
ncbi:MAG TPA: DUF2779 domain-containing protein [Candidatus Sulfotelmatobacter sp.]|nr:DUF2779 domain-containing protein [Candidatus Sulfotelmatobacter sp.]